MVVSQLQARSESQGGGSSRNSCISHPAPGEEDSVVTFEEWSLPTQDDKEEESLKEMVLFHLSPTHQPHPDVQPTHLESGLSEGGESLIACFDTDDELDNQPPLTDTVEESPSVVPLAEEWMGQICQGSVIPMAWNPESCPVELEDLEAADNHDSSSLDIGTQLEVSEKWLLELLDQDGAARGCSTALEPIGNSELLETSSEKARPFASLLESKGTLLEQPKVVRAEAETTQDSLIVCLESEDELEEASSLDQISNEYRVMVAAFSEAKPGSLSVLSNLTEKLLAEDNGVQESPLFSQDGEEADELQNWSLCGTQNSSIDPEIEDYSGHSSNDEVVVDDTTTPNLSELCLEIGKTEALNGREKKGTGQQHTAIVACYSPPRRVTSILSTHPNTPRGQDYLGCF
ncbi:hypothetical protein E2320_023003 [Naja naja]|nr:hypothetical protein E2320_023003 [Naja naja]